MLFKVYWSWIGIASALCALAFFIDKRASCRPGRRRLPEIVLLTLISFGGGIGGLLGIYGMHHKQNRHTKFHFRITAVLSCIAQAGILLLLYCKRGGVLT